jgi:hypothetical protein
MTNISLVPGVARITPNIEDRGAKNVYQNMQALRSAVVFYAVAWAILIGVVLTGTFLALYAVLFMFPLAAAGVGFLHSIPRYVQGKMLTRICEPGSDMWKAIALAYTSDGTKLSVVLASFVYPFWLPILWYQDLKRIGIMLKERANGNNISLGSDEFIFYKKQAKKYNRLLQAQGPVAAENFLMTTSVLTDVPNAAQVTNQQWKNGIRDEIVAYKERKYGPMSDYGI